MSRRGPVTTRRGCLGLLGAATLSACTPDAPRSLAELPGGWLGATPGLGHRLREARDAQVRPGEALPRRCEVLVLGAGIAGLACARRLQRAGVDIAVLDLEAQAGGNSRGHQLAGQACPLGAHYLPLPGPHAQPVRELLAELGLLRSELGRELWDERHLCHSPQERLFYKGQWIDGLLPPPQGPDARAQYRHFSQRVGEAQRELGFAMPTHALPWQAGHAKLDAISFASWLDAEGLRDPALRWYLDYCCRDDFGAGSAAVSAWAGLHYFASRHGFHAEDADEARERDAVLTWPEGNGWLSQQLSRPLQDVLQLQRLGLSVTPGRHQVELLCWNAAAGRHEQWQARQLVLATPLALSRRLLTQQSAALRALPEIAYAPWLVANLLLDQPPLQRLGAPLAWDNVSYGSEALGYVNAAHQRMDPRPGPLVLSLYWALPQAQRASLLAEDWRPWARRVLDELRQTHADIDERVQRIELARWGHAMAIPRPGLRSSPALAALREPQDRLHFAHADLCAYSVFEEAYTEGLRAAEQVLRRRERA